MAKWSFDQFLEGMTQSALGTLSGQMAGQQAAMQQQQALEAQRAQQFMNFATLQQREEEAAGQGREVLGKHLDVLDPASQAKALGVLTRPRPASPYNAANFQQFVRTGVMPPTPATQPVLAGQQPAGQPTGQPAPQRFPDWFQAAVGGRAPEPEAPPPSFTVEGETFTVGGITKEQQTAIARMQAEARKNIGALPQGSPLLAQNTGLLERALRIPRTLREYEDSFSALNTLAQVIPSAAATLSGQRGEDADLPRQAKAASDKWGRLSGLPSAQVLGALLAADEENQALEQTARERGRTVVMPEGWQGDRESIARLRQRITEARPIQERVAAGQAQPGDQELLARIERDAASIVGRAKAGISYKEHTARLNAIRPFIKMLDILDPEYDRKFNQIIQNQGKGMAQIMPVGGETFRKGVLRELRRDLITKIPSFRGVDQPSTQMFLREIAALNEQLGLPLTEIPAEIQEKLNPNEYESWQQKLREAKTWSEQQQANREARQRARERHEWARKALQQKGPSGAPLSTQLSALRVKSQNADEALERFEAEQVRKHTKYWDPKKDLTAAEQQQLAQLKKDAAAARKTVDDFIDRVVPSAKAASPPPAAPAEPKAPSKAQARPRIAPGAPKKFSNYREAYNYYKQKFPAASDPDIREFLAEKGLRP